MINNLLFMLHETWDQSCHLSIRLSDFFVSDHCETLNRQYQDTQKHQVCVQICCAQLNVDALAKKCRNFILRKSLHLKMLSAASWNKQTLSRCSAPWLDLKCQQGSNSPRYKASNHISVPHLWLASVVDSDQISSSEGFNSPVILLGQMLHIIAQHLQAKDPLTLHKSMQCLRMCTQSAHTTYNDDLRLIPRRREAQHCVKYRVRHQMRKARCSPSACKAFW